MTTKLRAASFQDNAVTTAKIAADAVTSPKIIANAVGSSEIDLTADYTFTGAVSGAGSIEVISSDATGGTGANIEIDLSTSTNFIYQKLHITGLYTAAGDNIRMTMRNDADDTYVGSGLYTSNIMAATSGSAGNTGGRVDGGWNQAYFEMNYYGYGDHAVNEDNNLEINFYDTTDTTYRAKYMYHRVGSGSDAVHVTETGTGRLLSEVKVDRIKLYAASGGNLIYRGYTLYGYKES